MTDVEIILQASSSEWHLEGSILKETETDITILDNKGTEVTIPKCRIIYLRKNATPKT